MDEKRVADYFALVGLPLNEIPSPIDEFINETSLKLTHKQDPITDITVINKNLGEVPPKGFKCLEFTPTGFNADLNHGSIRAPEMYLCYCRDSNKLPLVDIGVLYEGKDSKERVMPGCEIIMQTPYGHSANVNNSGNTRIYITFRRATNNLVSNYDSLAVMDISVILLNKGEVAPHSYCTINKPLNKGMMGSEVHICYKKSFVKKHYLTYKPVVLSRYPMEDNVDLSFPDRMAMFALPLGSTIEARPHANFTPPPIFSTFVLTAGKQPEKLYGASVLFYEQYDESKLDAQQKIALGLECDNESGFVSNNQDMEEINVSNAQTTVDIMHSKSICILSRAPFFDAFKKFLFFLLDIIKSREHEVTIERHIAHFLTMIPMPSPARPRIMIQLSTMAILLTHGDDTPLPKSGASFVETLKTLGPHNCIQLLLCVLFEQKILIHSLQPATMTSVAETATSMIFPFTWQCPYIPSCPLYLSYILNSPTPYILGIDSRFFDMYDPPSDVVCVDLDTNTLTLSDDRKGFNIKLLPKKPTKVLRTTLERLYEQLQLNYAIHSNNQNDDHSPNLRYMMQIEILIREAFLRFMACVLKGYNHHLRPITRAPTNTTTDIDSLFDIVGFVKSRDKSYTKFYALLIKTQSFSHFIEERSFIHDQDSCLTFFDECLDKVDENKEDPKLIEIDTYQSDSERTVFIMPPEPDLEDKQIYKYINFPILNPDFFPKDCSTSLSNFGGAKSSNGVQGLLNLSTFSPMTRRTPHEVKTSQKIASKHANVPSMWPKYLSWHSYSVWFIHLNSYVKYVRSKTKLLRKAMEVLNEMQNSKLQPPDEVSYRILMQLCGVYHQPVLAVKILFAMKKHGIIPNATTYGFYNKAVLECKWPTSGSSSYQLWRKLRNTIIAVHQFKQPILANYQSQIPDHLLTPEYDAKMEKLELESYVPDQRNSILIRESSLRSLMDNQELKLPVEDVTEDNKNNKKEIIENLSAIACNILIGDQSLILDKSIDTNLILKMEEIKICDEQRLDLHEIEPPQDLKEPEIEIIENFDQPEKKLVLLEQVGHLNEPSFDLTEANCATGLGLRIPVTQNDPLGVFSPINPLANINSSIEEEKNDSEELALKKSINDHVSSNFNQTSRSYELFPFDTESSDRLKIEANLRKMSMPTTIAGKGEILGSALRFAASKIATKYKEVTSTRMQPSKGSSSSSRASLNSITSANETIDKSRHSQLTNGIGNQVIEIESQEGIKQISSPLTTKHKAATFYGPLVTGLIGGLKSLQQTGALQGIATGITHVRDTVKETLSDGWSISTDGAYNDSLSGAPEEEYDGTDVANSYLEDECNKRRIPSVTTLKEKFYPIIVEMCTQSKCASCLNLMHDEEIMAGWTADESNLKTICQFCSNSLVPQINIYIKDYRRSITQMAYSGLSQSTDSILSGNSYLCNASLPHKLHTHVTSNPGADSGLSDVSGPSSDGLQPNSLSISEDQLAESNLSINLEKYEGKVLDQASDKTLLDNYDSLLGNLNNDSESFVEKNLETTLVMAMSVQSSQTMINIDNHSNMNNKSLHSKYEYENKESGDMITCNHHDKKQNVRSNNNTLHPLDRRYNFQLDPPEQSKLKDKENKWLSSHDLISSHNEEEMAQNQLISKCLESKRWMSDFSLDKKKAEKQSDVQSHLAFKGTTSLTNGKNTSSTLEACVVLPPYSVPYLSPLVLRKELENLIELEGDDCLSNVQLVDLHPIIYWNLIWYFQRLDLPSQLIHYVISSKIFKLTMNEFDVGIQTNSNQILVKVKALWDNPNLHDDHGLPLYIIWRKVYQIGNQCPKDIETKNMLLEIRDCIMNNNLLKPLRLLLEERGRRRDQNSRTRFHSIYRDLLFLSFVSLGRQNIDIDAFDKEYKTMLLSLTGRDSARMRVADRTPKIAAINCRNNFKDLEI